VYYDQRGRIKDYPTKSVFRVDAFLDGKRVPVLTNFDQVVFGVATELTFAPSWQDSVQLDNYDFQKDPNATLSVVQADGRFAAVTGSAIDLTPEATFVDGTKIGIINPTTEAPATAAAKRALKTAAAKSAPKNPTVPEIIQTVKIQQKPIQTVAPKQPVIQGPRVTK
jgi:hypothetical protein